MAIKVFIKRKIKDGKLREATRLIGKTRYGAMGQKGYISSETFTDHSDPNRILVTSMWHELKNWNNWKIGTASNNGCAGSVLSKIRAKFIYIISFVETF